METCLMKNNRVGETCYVGREALYSGDLLLFSSFAVYIFLAA